MIKAIKNISADYVISTRCLYNKWLVNNISCGAIKIAQEHRHHNKDKKYIKKLIRSLDYIDYFMPVSKELTDFYSGLLKGKHTTCKYIPHFLDNIPDAISELKNKQIISVGRLSPEKGFLDLIDIFSEVVESNPEWELHIVGDGQEKDPIIRKINELELENNVVLHGYQNKDYIENLMLNSSIYIMASYEESFGITLIEAQSYGLPCIAFDSARGATEIITNDVNGYLIFNRNKQLMIERMNYLMNNEEVRLIFGSESRKNSYNFSVENVSKIWVNFLKEIAIDNY
jgi:N-acetylglucosaminyldiphosphoundecaprenol N-acetyl-beta-D-mannosaminyltransferase